MGSWCYALRIDGDGYWFWRESGGKEGGALGPNMRRCALLRLAAPNSRRLAPLPLVRCDRSTRRVLRQPRDQRRSQKQHKINQSRHVLVRARLSQDWSVPPTSVQPTDPFSCSTIAYLGRIFGGLLGVVLHALQTHLFDPDSVAAGRCRSAARDFLGGLTACFAAVGPPVSSRWPKRKYRAGVNGIAAKVVILYVHLRGVDARLF